MSNALLRWLQLSLWLRLLVLTLIALVLAVAVWQLWQPPLQQSVSMQTQQQHQLKHYQATLRSLRHGQSLDEREAEIVTLRQALQPEEQPFSLVQLTASAGNGLKRWQPASDGGELTLELDWSHLQDVLRYLSERQPVVTLPQFTLKRVQERLQFQFVLVVNHER